MTAQNMGKKILSESGYDVTTVSNGAAAVKKIAEVKPDLVILDIYMPGYTGLEVCERVRANFDTANLPVLLTVGKMEPYRAEDGAKVRADGVIVKPFEATDLLAVVKKMTERIPASPAKRVVNDEPEPEEEAQQYSRPEPSTQSHVDVPSEIAVAPALAMEEFNTGQAEASAFAAPAMTWGALPELAVAEASQPSTDLPWSFDQPATLDAPVIDNSAVVNVEPTPDVEFTSAPQVGEVEVQQAPELEPAKDESSALVEAAQESSLAGAQEITDFSTSFSTASVEESHVTEEPKALEAAVGETGWNGWAHAEPEHEEEIKPGVIDDFEAKVAAAMSGFSTEPVQPAHEAVTNEISAEPVDDFEARVAAAMSGFATEPVVAAEATVEHVETEVAMPEPVAEAEHHEVPATESADDFEARVAAAMSGFATTEAHVEEPVAEIHTEPVVEVTPAPESAAPASADDFDARLAEAMSSFDTTPEVPAVSETGLKPQDETQDFEVPPLKAAINLNETMVLPQEAVLSLEEEMKRAMEQKAAEEPVMQAAAPVVAPEAIAWEPPKIETHEQEVHEPEPVEANAPEVLGEFDPMHVAHEADAAWGHEAEPVEEAASAAASSMLNAAVNSNGNAKLADAVHRAIDRLKPQLIAEIVKELKGE
jgi:CheY-like chemotaxis protein